MDYYVYLHRRKSDGVVFYVGKGRRNRYKNRKRSKGWLENVQQGNGYDYEIFKNHLTEQAALDLESQLISSPHEKWQLCNKVVSFKSVSFTKEEIEKNFEYDETSKTCLRYKVWNRSKIRKTARFAGDEAGGLLRTHGDINYWVLKLNGKTIPVHRLIYTLMIGEIPEGFVINHKNNNPLDNRLGNLEAISQAFNSRRTCKHRHETTGVRDIVWKRAEDSYSYTVAVWTEEDGRRKTKTFSHLKLGKDRAQEMALEFRKQKLQELSHLGYINNH